MPVPNLCPNAEQALLAHAWPAMSRTRKRLTARIIMMSGDCIEAADLHFELTGPGVGTSSSAPLAVIPPLPMTGWMPTCAAASKN